MIIYNYLLGRDYSGSAWRLESNPDITAHEALSKQSDDFAWFTQEQVKKYDIKVQEKDGVKIFRKYSNGLKAEVTLYSLKNCDIPEEYKKILDEHKHTYEKSKSVEKDNVIENFIKTINVSITERMTVRENGGSEAYYRPRTYEIYIYPKARVLFQNQIIIKLNFMK